MCLSVSWTKNKLLTFKERSCKGFSLFFMPSRKGGGSMTLDSLQEKVDALCEKIIKLEIAVEELQKEIVIFDNTENEKNEQSG